MFDCQSLSLVLTIAVDITHGNFHSIDTCLSIAIAHITHRSYSYSPTTHKLIMLLLQLLRQLVLSIAAYRKRNKISW